MAEPGKPAIRPQTRATRTTTRHTAAVAGAVLSGFGALVAFVFGSPLDFGIALALCGTCWIAADFIEWTARSEHSERVAPQAAGPALPLGTGCAAGHVVFVAAPQGRWRPEPRSEISLAA